MSAPEDKWARKVRWGIISTSSTATRKVIPALQRCPNAEPIAIASREPARAAEVAEALNIPRVHETYDALLTDPTVDAVYIPLPNSMHAGYTMRAAAAKKHVLCEKPAAISAAAAERMTRACDEAGVLFMEGFMYRFLPQVKAVRGILREGTFGYVRRISITMSYNLLPNHSRIRLQSRSEGGAVADVGAYCIDLACLLLDSAPKRVFCMARQLPDVDVEVGFGAILQFPLDVLVMIDGGFDRLRSSRIEIIGTNATMAASPIFMAGSSQLLTVTAEGTERVLQFPTLDPFQLEFAHFSDCVLSGNPPAISIQETRRSAGVMEALRTSIRTGMPIDLEPGPVQT